MARVKPCIVTLGIAALALTITLGACSEADINGTPLDGIGWNDASVDGSASGQTCTDTSPPTPMDPATLPSCCTDGAAHCVPADKISPSVASHLASCTGGFCVPDPYIRTGKVAPPPHCKSMGDADGVCLSVCIPQVAQFKSLLPQSSCAPDEKCAPCISPLDKLPTGACDIGKGGGPACAPPPEGGASANDGAPPNADCPHKGPPLVDPSGLPSCFAGGGAHCLDKKLVPASMASRLATCATGLCVPDDFIAAGGNFVPATCDSLGGDEGRCLHVSLPEVDAQKDRLHQSTCKAYERCVPCFDPRDLKDTGACKLSCDPGPARPKPGCPHAGPPYEDPNAFPSCDPNGGAHCLSAADVSPQLQAELAACSGGFCVPDTFIAAAGRFVPPTCSAIAGRAEGRCMHEKIPKVAAQTKLTAGSCRSYERCVPCFDPNDGTDTTACRQSCDPGPAKPKYVFQGCCGAQGKCVPSSMVPASEQANLTLDSCSRGDDLCVPTEMLAPQFQPPTCTAFSLVYFGNYHGVCLSNCLQFSGLQSLAIKQGDCDGQHLCVPCTKPGGAPTGAPGCP